MNGKLISLFALLSLMVISSTSCRSSIDSKLDRMENVAKKWEAKRKNGAISPEDCVEFKKDLQKAGGAKDLSQEKGISEKQIERATSLGERLYDLAMDCQ